MEELDAELVRDHIAGVEVELVELVEQHHRAQDQGRIQEAEDLQAKIAALHAELAVTADVIATQAVPDAAHEDP